MHDIAAEDDSFQVGSRLLLLLGLPLLLQWDRCLLMPWPPLQQQRGCRPTVGSLSQLCVAWCYVDERSAHDA